MKRVKDRPPLDCVALVSLFQEAAEPLPKNLSRDIRWAQQIGWIAPSSSNPDMCYLTTKGEGAVRAQFSKELRRKTRFVVSPMKAAAKWITETKET